MSEFQTISINQKRLNYVLGLDITINHNHETIEYFYKTDKSTKARTYKTITLADLNKLADVKLSSIDSVSSCKTDDCSFLVILGTDGENNIHLLFYNLKTKTARYIPFKRVLQSKLTKATITRSPSKVLYRDKRDTPHSSDSYVLVIATQGEGTYLVILSIDESYNVAVQFMEPFTMKNVKLSDFGSVTSICILPSNHSDQRMGHGDPHVILGFSLGHILNFRIRANIYSHKAQRIRAPKDLSRFVEFPGFPITKISCARAYNSLKTITAFAQEKPAHLTDRNSYVQLLESQGDGFSEVKKMIQASGSSVDIIESELIPSSTTAKDDQIQLSVLFLDHEKSLFTSSVWEISPETTTPQPIEEVLHLSMDHKQCVQSVVGRTRTQLDKDKFLTNTPQKVILTILKANESNKREAPSSTVDDVNTKPAKRRKGSKGHPTPALQGATSETSPKANESNKREAPSSTVDDIYTKPVKRRKGSNGREIESPAPALQDQDTSLDTLIPKANELNKREAPSSTEDNINTKPAETRKGSKDRKIESPAPALQDQDTSPETLIPSSSTESPITERNILPAELEDCEEEEEPIEDANQFHDGHEIYVEEGEPANTNYDTGKKGTSERNILPAELDDCEEEEESIDDANQL